MKLSTDFIHNFLPVDTLSVPAVVTVSSWCEFVVVASRVRQIWPELFRVFHFLSDLLNEFIETRLTRVVSFVAVCVSLIVSVAASSSVRRSTICWEVFISRELERLHFDLLVVSAVLLTYWISCSLWPFDDLVLFIIDEKISVWVEERIGASLTTQLRLTATHKNSFADVVTGFLTIELNKVRQLHH